jgi:hypothetical protein
VRPPRLRDGPICASGGGSEVPSVLGSIELRDRLRSNVSGFLLRRRNRQNLGNLCFGKGMHVKRACLLFRKFPFSLVSSRKGCVIGVVEFRVCGVSGSWSSGRNADDACGGGCAVGLECSPAPRIRGVTILSVFVCVFRSLSIRAWLLQFTATWRAVVAALMGLRWTRSTEDVALAGMAMAGGEAVVVVVSARALVSEATAETTAGASVAGARAVAIVAAGSPIVSGFARVAAVVVNFESVWP